jgi:hypothetical protein
MISDFRIAATDAAWQPTFMWAATVRAAIVDWMGHVLSTLTWAILMQISADKLH